MDRYDIAIIGGGINGCGIAREAALRGAKVFLCDAQDIGGATSCASTKLIHGGLRYLESYEFSLVRKALHERKMLHDMAPHLIRPLEFFIPYDKTTSRRPYWLIRLGLWFYDLLSPRHLPKSKAVSGGFSYYDCWVDDHRLVIANALDALQHGATIQPFNGCKKAAEKDDFWHLTLADGSEISSKTLVNAAGPWAGAFCAHIEGAKPQKMRLIKGSHIVVPKMFEEKQAHLLQQPDGRVVFAIPYEENFTLIGTTEEVFEGDPYKVLCSAAEKAYLCAAMHGFFEKKITPDDIVWHYSGVRPLPDDGHENASKVSRDYTLELVETGGSPLLNIWGGKLTTYRKLALDALQKISPYLPPLKAVAPTLLPGGDVPPDYACVLMKKYPWLPPENAARYARSYGTLCEKFLSQCNALKDMGRHYGAGLYEAEVAYLKTHEWATTPEAILWRRTKCGLHMTEGEREEFRKRF